jgi:uncharacterized protein (DUF433 family)
MVNRSSKSPPSLSTVMPNGQISAHPSVLGGKPCVRGTRLSVEFLLELAASGASQEQILAQYPQLTPEGLAAAFRYAAPAYPVVSASHDM